MILQSNPDIASLLFTAVVALYRGWRYIDGGAISACVSFMISYTLIIHMKQSHCVCLTTTVFNPLNAELNQFCHLLALVGVHHIVHVSRIRVNPLNAELNPICHLLALVGDRHIVHVSRIRVNRSFSRVCKYASMRVCVKRLSKTVSSHTFV